MNEWIALELANAGADAGASPAPAAGDAGKAMPVASGGKPTAADAGTKK